jgi:hypothetical protein
MDFWTRIDEFAYRTQRSIWVIGETRPGWQSTIDNMIDANRQAQLKFESGTNPLSPPARQLLVASASAPGTLQELYTSLSSLQNDKMPINVSDMQDLYQQCGLQQINYSGPGVCYRQDVAPHSMYVITEFDKPVVMGAMTRVAGPWYVPNTELRSVGPDKIMRRMMRGHVFALPVIQSTRWHLVQVAPQTILPFAMGDWGATVQQVVQNLARAWCLTRREGLCTCQDQFVARHVWATMYNVDVKKTIEEAHDEVVASRDQVVRSILSNWNKTDIVKSLISHKPIVFCDHACRHLMSVVCGRLGVMYVTSKSMQIAKSSVVIFVSPPSCRSVLTRMLMHADHALIVLAGTRDFRTLAGAVSVAQMMTTSLPHDTPNLLASSPTIETVLRDADTSPEQKQWLYSLHASSVTEFALEWADSGNSNHSSTSNE